VRRCLPLILLCLTLAAAGCEDDASADIDTAEDTIVLSDTRPTNPYLADSAVDDTTPSDDTTEPIFVGKPCERDADCTTGRCYGKATAQGSFEQAVCQDGCVLQEDFSLYCDSDADCCNGTCCIDCGFQRGLCVSN
jgi:hypothetical protein